MLVISGISIQSNERTVVNEQVTTAGSEDPRDYCRLFQWFLLKFTNLGQILVN